MDNDPQLLSFNAFGMVKLSRTKVTVLATSITQSGKAINRSLTEEFETIETIVPYEYGSAIFGADLNQQGHHIITYNEITSLASERPVGEFSQVSNAVVKVLNLILSASKSA